MPRRSNDSPSAATVSQRLNPSTAARPEIPAPDRWQKIVICILLVLAVWFVFGQTLRHGFVDYDDDQYVYANPAIARGLHWNGIAWAFTHSHVYNWHPLTSLFHMLDCQLFGLNPGGHHLTNILLHMANVILLFLVLRSLTGRLWPSAFVAALFAIHPLRVESVAWVSERKDVLSGLFFLLTIGAYVRYARRQFAVGRYLLVMLLFTLGLLSKPMLVTLPFLLLLLDYWPLQRVSVVNSISSNLSPRGSHLALLLEKMPFLLLSGAACAATILAQRDAIGTFDEFNLRSRIANALVTYVVYLRQMFYPADLVVFYPHPKHVPLWPTMFSGLVLLVISAGALASWRKRPWLLVGWLWYVGMLVPVIGIIQVGSQAHADRYTYLPQIGVYLLLAWSAAELCDVWPHGRAVLGTAGVFILVALGVRAHEQTKYWRDSISLWEHTLACTSNNYVAHLNLGGSLAERGRLEEAISHYEQAIQIKPGYAEAHYNLGVALATRGLRSEAISSYERAIKCKPDYPDALNNLASELVAEGKIRDAIPLYERAIQLKPDFPEGYYNLGNAFSKSGKSEEAIERYEQALRLKPAYAEAHYNLGNRLAAQGKLEEAIRHLEEAIRIKPDYSEAYNNLGNKFAAQKKWAQAVENYEHALRFKPDYAEAHNNFGAVLAGQEKMDEAIQHYRQASQIKPDYAEAHANLGNALAAQGKTGEALEQLHEALNLATAQTNAALARAILSRLKAHQSQSPGTESP